MIPPTSRREILDRIHTGHQGIVKCKRRARGSCFWPNMNKQIEQMVASCGECQRLQASKETPPLLPHEVPEKPWQKVGTNLFQLGSTNYLIVTDYYSNWPELYELKKANSANVIQATKEAFARHGIPVQVVSDNGSQYKSHDYRKFSKNWQFLHKTSSPKYPRSNGLAESSVKIVKRMLKNARVQNRTF